MSTVIHSHVSDPPAWVFELVSEWARSGARLGLPRVSPMWSRAVDDGEEDVSARPESRACAAAIERLRADHPDEHQAVTGYFRRHMAVSTVTGPLLDSALVRIGQWVDAACVDNEGGL